MKAGTKRLTTPNLAGGLSVGAVVGCGSPDMRSGPEWTFAIPAAPLGRRPLCWSNTLRSQGFPIGWTAPGRVRR